MLLGVAQKVGRSLAAMVGLWALWVVAFVGSASAALPAGCSEAGSTVTCAFGETGGEQTWTVPAGVTSAAFDVQGAQGGSIIPAGGLGGEATADLPLTPGAPVTLVVGGQGGSCFGGGTGFNGGGAGGSGGGGCSGGSGVFLPDFGSGRARWLE
jgi:hypothetical protein